jgi:hypothetical protein
MEERKIRHVPVEGEIYRHFKGNLYKIVCIGLSCNDISKNIVAYQAMYGDHKIFMRPLDEFMSDVDHDKYPLCNIIYRFTKID